MRTRKKKNKPKLHKHKLVNISKQKKENKLKMLDNLKTIIINNNCKLPSMFSSQSDVINLNSWFNIKKNLSITTHDDINYNTTNTCSKNNNQDKNFTKCKKYEMLLTDSQKQIINKWLEATTIMYNETVKYIKKNYEFTKNAVVMSTKIQNEKIKNKNDNYSSFADPLIRMLENKTIYDTNYSNEITRKINRFAINSEKISNIESEKLKLTQNKHGYYNGRYLRNNMTEIKENIIKNTILNNNKKTAISAHILDQTIFNLATNIKSARTNLERHNIKSFRIRYLKLNRNSQTLDIEKNEIHNNKIFPNKLGPIIYKYNGQICEPNINRGVKINYNSITNKYTLLVPNYENPITENKEENMIILDPGLRTFMTGISENSTIDICNDVNKTIKTKLEKNNILFEKAKQKINECESLQESEKQKLIDKKRNIKNKRNKRAYKKIHNMVDDLHWKTANYLAKNFNYILLGNMSTKSITRKSNKNLADLQKTACLRTRYFEFYQRLEFKCKQYKTLFKSVNECYTSKLCSICGNVKEDLGESKIYNCASCNLCIDRDINGARNIYIKSLI